MKRALAAVMAGLLLAGCAKAGGPAAAPAGGDAGARGSRHPYTVPHVLRYATSEDVAGLNPHLNQQTTLGFMASLTMAWLTKFDRHNRPVPELTTVVPTRANGGISADGLTITWHLRHGVRWSDGFPFSAEDVVFSTRAVLNQANNEVSRDGWDLITKIDQPDRYTVVYHLKRPFAGYAAQFFGSAGANPCLLPKHLLGNLANINDAPYNGLPVGIGPFRYTSWKRSDSVQMEANPYYFRGRPKLQRVVFKIVPDRNTVLTQLQTHELDMWLPVAAAYYDRLRAIPGIALLRQPSYYFSHLDFQNQHPPLDDPRVRRALRLALDRKTINTKIRHGLGIIQDDPVSPTNPSFDAGVPTDPYDPAQAGRLLDAAGWPLGAGGLRAKNGKPLNLVFVTATGSPDADQQIELIRAGWKALGVTIDVRHYPSPLLFAPYAGGGIVYGGKWDVIIFQWGGDVIGDLSILYSCGAFPPAGQNDPRWCDRSASEAMEKFKREYDERKRQPYAQAVQRAIAREVPVTVLWVNEDVYAYNSDLTGFHPNQVSQFDDFMKVDI